MSQLWPQRVANLGHFPAALLNELFRAKPLLQVVVQFEIEAFGVQPLGCCFGRQAKA
jgi:hypothetical protein